MSVEPAVHKVDCLVHPTEVHTYPTYPAPHLPSHMVNNNHQTMTGQRAMTGFMG
jgi:hypothetical protein